MTPLLFVLTTFGIGTPVVRVATSIVLFAAEHGVVYVAITSVVLLLLILSFVIGAAG